MNRLTEKYEFGYKGSCLQSCECSDKLGQLEDIEEELGIDLISFYNNYKELMSLKGRNLFTNIEEFQRFLLKKEE